MSRVSTDGKLFSAAGERFSFHGVTYGTFRPRPADGARFPERDRLKLDFAAMREAGFTVVRTYTTPPDDLLELASDNGLRVLAGVHYEDWRYLVGASRRQHRDVARRARSQVAAAVEHLAERDEVLALCLGNEIPADVVRWIGPEVVAKVLSELADLTHDRDPELLVTYANYPTSEYLPLNFLDFSMFNVFLEHKHDFRRYLTRLQNLAGDRPLVLGELGLHAGSTPTGEREQAEVLDWQLECVLERGVAGACLFSWTDEWWVGESPVEGWHFGVTRADRSPRPSLAVASRWNQRSIADLPGASWPSLSVVICAYNAAATLDECLRHACDLAYPELEVIVVDDGSSDDTAAIARRHPRARLVTIPHGGLATARNEGYRVANGDLVAYLDSDAYPAPEWPYYLALGLDGPSVAGTGGPNLPPPTDPPGAHQVAQAPGGPVHVLVSDDRAEHVPGCNMAFWKEALVRVGGFDPVFVAAGDDVDLCWRLLDSGLELGFHPAAYVWHHRRPGIRPYLRQQRGYGRSEALLEARHPDRFTASGTARWRGRIYGQGTSPHRQRVYRGLYGSAAFQSVYRSPGHGWDLAHQLGVPAAIVALATTPLAALWPILAVVPMSAVLALTVLAAVDIRRADPPFRLRRRRLRFRLGVALMHVLQPLVRAWGRFRHRDPARNGLPAPTPLAGPARAVEHGLLLPLAGERRETVAAAVSHLRGRGYTVTTPNGWEAYDVRLRASPLLDGDLLTSSHPPGCLQLRIRRRPRWGRLAAAVAVAAAVATVAWVVALFLAFAITATLAVGWWRTRQALRHLAKGATCP